MKRVLWIPIVVIIFILLACQQKEENIAPVALQFDQILEAAVVQLSEGEIIPGIESLLDAIVLTNPKGYISEEFEVKIGEAKGALAQQDMDGTFERIREARLMLSAPAVINEEDNVEVDPAPVAEAVKSLILQAKDQFQEGKAVEGVTSILEALLLFNPL